MVMEMRLRWINWTHRAYLLQRYNSGEMDGKGIHLKGIFDSYPHVVYSCVSCPLSCYADITAYCPVKSLIMLPHLRPPLSVVLEVEVFPFNETLFTRHLDRL